MEELLTGRHLLISYYYTVNVAVTSSVAKELKRRNSLVCIVNVEKMKHWEGIDLTCDQGATVLVFDAESESEVPPDYLLVTSARDLRLSGAKKYRVRKVEGNVYRADGEGVFYFKVTNNGIQDYDLPARNPLMEVLRELGGEATLRDLVNIYSHRSGKGRDEVREELSTLAKLGKIRVGQGRVKLADYNGGPEG